MITRDYLLRMIHQLAQVLARVLKLNEAKCYDESLEEINASSRRLIGMDIRMLTSLSDTEFIRLLGLGDRFDLEKCVVAAELLRMVGEVKLAQGDEASTYECRVASLSLFLELLRHETGTLPKEYSDSVERLVKELSVYELSLALRQRIFQYYEYAGRFDLAENVLVEILQQEPGLVSEGVKFYTRLQAKSDEDLSKGNLPRNEVEEGLNNLKRRL